MDTNQTVYLLSIKGQLAPKDLESARLVHNTTAGTPANVATARGLGDLSHMVFVPDDHDHYGAKDFLILDQWNNLDGINQFFSNAHVQEQAGQIFAQRDPVVWMPAREFIAYHLPAPFGKNDRYIGVVRGKVRSHEEALAIHNAIIEKTMAQSRAAGCISHEAYIRMAAPGSPESLEFCAVDTWYDKEGMNRIYDDPGFMTGLMALFDGEPSANTWTHPQGEWVEW